MSVSICSVRQHVYTCVRKFLYVYVHANLHMCACACICVHAYI